MGGICGPWRIFDMAKISLLPFDEKQVEFQKTPSLSANPRKGAPNIPLCIVLSRKVDCDVCERVAKLKKTLKLAVPPSSLNTLQKERTRTV